MKFVDWVHQWIKVYKEPFVGSACMDTINACLKHILSAFGERDFDSINGIEIQKFILSLSDTPNMQDKCRKYLSDIFKYAYRNRVISWDPMSAVKFRSYKFVNTKPMNAVDRQKFIDSLVGKSYELLYLTYLYTGARRAEVITPGSFIVDFDNDLIRIHGSKTEGSDRIVPLFHKLYEKILSVPDYKFYYTSYKPNWVYLCFARHMKSIGLSGYCVRSLRCTFSLMCYELGVRDTTIQSWLGHTTKDTTNTFYLDKLSIATSKLSSVQSEIDLVNRSL